MTRLIAPEVGALVDYGRDSFNQGPGKYRVTGWMRVAPEPTFDPNDWIGRILFETCREDTVTGKRMQWCLRAEATHVTLSGICGAVAPIEDCVVTGMVDWPAEHLEEDRRRAQLLGERHEMLF